MFNKDQIDLINKLADRIEKIFADKCIMITVLGYIKPCNSMYGPIPITDIDKPIKKESYTLEEFPFRRFINTKDIQTIYEHEKGTVIVLHGEAVISNVDFIDLSIELGWSVKN